jgi:hypothetical protein
MSVAPLYQKETPDHSRGLSAALWRNSLQAYVANDPAYGVRIKDDFTEHNPAITGTGTAELVRNWVVDRDGDDADGTVSFLNAAGPDGVAILASTTTSGDDGVTARYSPALVNLPTHGSNPRGRVVLEARVDDLDIAEVWFVGLSEANNQFLDGDSLLPDDQDYIGFYSDDHGATVKFVIRNDNDGGTAVEDEVTVLDADLDLAEFNKLGLAVNVDGSIEICVNGKRLFALESQIDRDAAPIETLTPRLCALTGAGSDAPNIDVDSVDCFVESNT